MGTDQHTIRRLLPALAVTAVVAAACSSGDDDSAALDASVGESTMDVSQDVGDAEDVGGVGGVGDDDGDLGDEGAAEESRGLAPDQSAFDVGAIGRDVIVEMRVVVASDDIQRTVASVSAAAATLGGGIASSDVDFGDGTDDDRGFAVLVVKVPPESVERLLDGLDDTGTLQSIDQSARDVTEQLVDLDVRIANARESVANVRGFMDRTENLSELVALEAELTQRQTELERLEAQQRNLSDRVALATITVEVVPTASVPEPVVDEEQGIGDALDSGWEAFVAVMFGLAFVVAATLPFLAATALLGLVAWLWMRRRDRAVPPAHSDAAPEPDTASDVHEPVG